jgi:hypothetical protein
MQPRTESETIKPVAMAGAAAELFKGVVSGLCGQLHGTLDEPYHCAEKARIFARFVSE